MSWAGRLLRRAGGVAVGLVLASMAATAVAQTAPTVIEVRPGDTFSSIAAGITGGATTWRRAYRADLTGLANPNRITVGMRFEVATAADGKRYLRLLAPGQDASAGSSMAARVAASPPAAPAAPAAAEPATASLPGAAVPRSSGTAGAGAASEPLVIGVLPNISATILTTNYQYLSRYLERNGQKVTVVVPPNFREFYDAMMRGDYDVAISAPHFARVAQADRKLIPFLMYLPQINGMFVAPSESTVKSPKDLRDRAVAFANPTSLVAMYGRQWIRQGGLQDSEYETRAARTDLGVGRMMLSGDAVAAIMSNGEFRSLPPDEVSRLKVVEIFAKIPNFIFMANPRLEGARLNRLKTQLLGFLADPADGVPFTQATGFSNLVEVDGSVMRELDAFAAATRQAMSPAK